MTSVTVSVCLYPTCGEIVNGTGYCERHRARMNLAGGPRTGKPQPRGRPWDRHAWTERAAAAVRAHPYCDECGAREPDVQLVAHHVNFTPGRAGVADPRSPLRVLCQSCHQKLHRRAEHDARRQRRRARAS